jgi:WhiB family redox-sensing transcriptional regulator
VATFPDPSAFPDLTSSAPLHAENAVALHAENAVALRAEHAAEMTALMPEDLIEGMEWQARALCAQTDPEAFFPEKGGSTREAKRVCLSCEVRVDCLEYALANDERFGIWGGLSERERRRLKKQAV